MNSRSAGVVAAIEGFFAAMWFSWGGSDADSWLQTLVGIGAVISLIALLVGIALMVRGKGEPTPLQDDKIKNTYRKAVRLEGAAAVLGALILGAIGAEDYVAAWIGLIVGAHFVPFAKLFGNPAMRVMGVAMIITAVAATIVNLSGDAVTSTVMGPMAGFMLVVNAWAAILSVRSSTAPEKQRPAGI